MNKVRLIINDEEYRLVEQEGRNCNNCDAMKFCVNGEILCDTIDSIRHGDNFYHGEHNYILKKDEEKNIG